MKQCKICLRPVKNDDGDLCRRHSKIYIYELDINSFRLRRNKGKRRFHSHERELTKILEKRYGKSNIVTGVHPVWAISNRGALLEYDILIKDRKTLIEYNGIQHYKHVRRFHKTLEEFKDQQHRDDLKYKLAILNGYKIIVIKYDEPLFEDYIVTKIERN